MAPTSRQNAAVSSASDVSLTLILVNSLSFKVSSAVIWVIFSGSPSSYVELVVVANGVVVSGIGVVVTFFSTDKTFGS